jgi:hypothetical protein
MSTKCNHLVARQEQDKKCFPSPDSRTHYWLPTGNIETKFNGSIQIDFYCKYCNARTTNFLSKEEYETHKKVLGV